MANNYYDATGVLVLDTVTPIIAALFGDFNLDPSYPGNGEAYISVMAETNNPDWDGIKQNLLGLADQLDITISEEGEPEIDTVLEAFAGFFGTEGNSDLWNLIEHHDFKYEADLDALFLIASCFNDGHNLTAIRFEGCWHCSKPRLFEFGGNSLFISQPLDHAADTTRTLEMATSLHKALTESKLDKAAVLIANEATRLLAGISDPGARETIRALVAEHLLQPPSLAPAD